MKRTVQFFSIVFVLFISSAALANEAGFDYIKDDLSGYQLQPKLKVADDQDDAVSNFSRNGHATYLFAGYLYDYRLLSNNTETAVQGNTSATYTPNSVFDKGQHGFEIGFGHEWNRYIDLQLIYQQLIEENSSEVSGGVTTNTNYSKIGMITDLAFILNPDSRYQLYAKLGVSVDAVDSHLSIAGVNYTQKNNEIDVNPVGALGLLIQFTEHTGMRIEGMYTTSFQNSDSQGDVSARVGLNYIF